MTLNDLKLKVQRMLTEVVGSVKVDKDGDYLVTYNSATVYVEFWEDEVKQGDNRFGVRFTCPLVHDVPASNELFKWVATDNNYRFAKMSVILDKDEKKATLMLGHTLLGDDLDTSEVKNALASVLFTGDSLDTEIQKRFGGQLFGKDES